MNARIAQKTEAVSSTFTGRSHPRAKEKKLTTGKQDGEVPRTFLFIHGLNPSMQGSPCFHRRRKFGLVRSILRNPMLPLDADSDTK